MVGGLGDTNSTGAGANIKVEAEFLMGCFNGRVIACLILLLRSREEVEWTRGEIFSMGRIVEERAEVEVVCLKKGE